MNKCKSIEASNNKGHKGSKCYTNGEITILLYPDDEIPEGFTPGRKPTQWNPWSKGLTKETDERIVSRDNERLKSRNYTPLLKETKQKLSKALIGKNVGKIHDPKQEELRFKTMKENGTLNTSKPEEEMYKDLCNLYGEEDVVHHYKDERYPFNCDFYIKSLDKFIELNLHWTHGKEPYDNSNTEHIELVEKYKSKNTNYFNTAIYVWTVLDPKKLQTFRDNNLNFEIIYKNLVINK